MLFCNVTGCNLSCTKRTVWTVTELVRAASTAPLCLLPSARTRAASGGRSDFIWRCLGARRRAVSLGAQHRSAPVPSLWLNPRSGTRERRGQRCPGWSPSLGNEHIAALCSPPLAALPRTHRARRCPFSVRHGAPFHPTRTRFCSARGNSKDKAGEKGTGPWQLGLDGAGNSADGRKVALSPLSRKLIS